MNSVLNLLVVFLGGLLSFSLNTSNAMAQSPSSPMTYPADEYGRWGVGLGAGPNLPAPVDAVEDELGSDLAGAIWVRYHLTPTWQFAFHYERLEFKSNATSLDYWGPSVLYRPWQGNKWNIYLGLGAGIGRAINFPRSTDRQFGLAFMGITGVDYFFHRKWSVGVEVSSIFVDLDDKQAKSAQLMTPMLALTYYPGKEETRSAPVVHAPKDSDGDGVVDGRDVCPNTLRGTEVNRLGCPTKAPIELRVTVEFDVGSDVIKPEYYEEIRRIADLMIEHSDQKVSIEGHTDSTGNRAKNIDLSSRRAKSLEERLVSIHGIQASRITSRGFGPDKPVATNDTPEGRAVNRRVVLVFSGE